MTQAELIEYFKGKIADEAKAQSLAKNDLNITYHEARQGAFLHVVDFLQEITISGYE